MAPFIPAPAVSMQVCWRRRVKVSACLGDAAPLRLLLRTRCILVNKWPCIGACEMEGEESGKGQISPKMSAALCLSLICKLQSLRIFCKEYSMQCGTVPIGYPDSEKLAQKQRKRE